MCLLCPRHQANSRKEAGYSDAISGVTDGQHFHINGTKDPDYTMMLMNTYGTLERRGNERKRCKDGATVKFKYPNIIWNQYTYQNYVDDHNNCPKSTISIENTWDISYWINRVFALLIGKTEVNILLALTNIYGHEPMETHEFWKKLSKTLLC